jgi:hypothetical protein
MKKIANYLLALSLGACFLLSTNALQAQSEVHGGYLKNYWTNGYLFGGQDFGCMVNENGQPDADANAWTFEPLGKGWEGQKSTFRLKHTATGLYLHIQNGKLELGKIQKGWHSAMWVFEELEGLTATFRIKNFWKPTLYLNNEKVSKTNGVECTVSKDSFNSSYWVIEGDD